MFSRRARSSKGNNILDSARQPTYDPVEDYLPCVLEDFLPDDHGLVSVLKSYCDESGTHDDSPTMCVAGFLFPARFIRSFTREWNKALGAYGLQFLHMKEFVPRQGKRFGHLTEDDRDSLLEELIRIILDRAVHGTIVSFDHQEYKTIVSARKRSMFGSAYSACSFLYMSETGRWSRENRDGEEIFYLFEKGDPHEGEAALHMVGISNDPLAAMLTCHAGHGFSTRTKAVPLQAGDLLAWEFVKFAIETRLQRIRPPRRSFRELLLARPGFIRDIELKGPRIIEWLDDLEEIRCAAKGLRKQLKARF